MWLSWPRSDRDRLIDSVAELVRHGRSLRSVGESGTGVSLERVIQVGDPVFYRQVIRDGRGRQRTDYLAAGDAAASFVRQIGVERAWSVVRLPVTVRSRATTAIVRR